MVLIIPVVAVNEDHVNVQEPIDENNLQNEKDISCDGKPAMLLKTLPPSRINISDDEVDINIIRNTPVDAVLLDRGSVDTLSELCETPCSTHSQLRKKERKKIIKKRRVNEIFLVKDTNKSSRNMKKQEYTCTNDDSNPLKVTQIGDSTEQKIGKNNVNVNDKNKSKEYSTCDEEINVNENELKR